MDEGFHPTHCHDFIMGLIQFHIEMGSVAPTPLCPPTNTHTHPYSGIGCAACLLFLAPNVDHDVIELRSNWEPADFACHFQWFLCCSPTSCLLFWSGWADAIKMLLLLLLLCDCGSLALLELLSTVPPLATSGTATIDTLGKTGDCKLLA